MIELFPRLWQLLAVLYGELERTDEARRRYSLHDLELVLEVAPLAALNVNYR